MITSKLDTNCKYIRVAGGLYACIFPLVLFLLLETLNPASRDGLFMNPWQNMGSVVYSAFFIFMVAAIGYSVLGSVFLSFAATAFLFLAAYVVNYFKIMLSGGVFVPSDLALANAAFQVMDAETVVIERTLLATIFLVVLLLVPLYFVKFRFDFRKRLALLSVSIIVFLTVFVFGFIANFAHSSLGLVSGRTIDRYRDSGFVLGFFAELVGIGNPVFVETTPYEITLAFTPSQSLIPTRAAPFTPESVQTRKNPNVIVIMSESFFDPNVLPNITFSQNPVPNFSRLRLEHMNGKVIVPTWGGGTANTELEFLAGSPHVFFGNRWYVPFENVGRYFSQNITSALPWMFRENGYRTVGIHTFYGSFYNRDRIYPRLGFDMFIASEDMPDAVYKGRFISDAYFTERIMEQIVLAEDDGKPLFLFGISMQNHWPFYEEKYCGFQPDITGESQNLTCGELGIVNSFLQGIFDADKELGRLIGFIESRDTPTIVVFFGDHMPILGTHEQRIFETLGFLNRQEEWAWRLCDLEAAFSTDYLVWTNFEHGRGCFGVVSTFMLGALVAELSGINLNRYFMYMLGASDYLRVLTNELFLRPGGVMDYGFFNRSNREVQLLESLWNYKMFGRGDFFRSLSEIAR